MKKSTCIAVFFAAGLGGVVVGGIAVTGAALAMSAGRPAPENKPARDPRACFDSSQVQSFQTEKNGNIIIISNWNEAYELTMAPACIGLDSSFRIGIKSRVNGMSNICGPFDGEIVYSDMGDRPLKTCPIQAIRHLTPEEAVAYGIRPRGDKPK
jgi:hypothetical protein